MKAEQFKTLCRRILHLEENGWRAEMPDDWKIMVFTRHGVEPLDSWMDEPQNKQILLCGKSANEEPICHNADKIELVKSEIKRMIEKDYPCDNYEQEVGYHAACYELIDFIDSLNNTVEQKMAYLLSQYPDSMTYNIGVFYSREEAEKVRQSFEEEGCDIEEVPLCPPPFDNE